MQKNPIEVWAKSAQKRLAYGYEQTADLLMHNASLGAVREIVVKEVLQTILPASIEIGTGQIIDGRGSLSNQIDLVVTRNNVPAFRFTGGQQTYFLETVLASIEVKSMLNSQGLKQALDNCNSVRKLFYQGNSLRSKGANIFKEAFEWVEAIGGLDLLDKVLVEPSQQNSVFCPNDVWKVIRFVFYWLHWERGDFKTQYAREALEQVFPIDADYSFFFQLLFLFLGEPDFNEGMKRFEEAAKVKQQFFESLYAHITQDELLPYTYIFAYGGYQKPEKIAEATRKWFAHNRSQIFWSMMPKVILNQHVCMYRTFNRYHCVAYEYPILFFMTSLVNALAENINFEVSYGLNTGLQQYFDPAWLKSKHPKYSPSYFVWEIPIDNSSAGEFWKPTRTEQQDN